VSQAADKQHNLKRFQQPASEPMQPMPPGSGAVSRQGFPPPFSDKSRVEGKFGSTHLRRKKELLLFSR
jgi:hypothetical protein